jgi:hypothetical protein
MKRVAGREPACKVAQRAAFMCLDTGDYSVVPDRKAVGSRQTRGLAEKLKDQREYCRSIIESKKIVA